MTAPIRLRFRQTVCPAGGGSLHLLLEVAAPAAAAQRERPALDLALVLDRSGSMGGMRIATARRAAVQAVRLLGPRDRIALVAYDDRIEVPVPLRAVTPALASEVEHLVAGIEPRGGTDLASGWRQGCAQLAGDAAADRIKTCILLTDGQANAGEVAPGVLAQQAGTLRTHGIRTSAFGIGDGFNEALLGALADAGGGAFQYIDDPARLVAALTREVQESLTVTARGVVVTLNAGARGALAWRVIGGAWTAAAQAGGWCVQLHDLVHLQAVQFAVRVDVAPAPHGEPLLVTAQVSSSDGAMTGSATAELPRVSAEQVLTARPDPDVEPVVAALEAAALLRQIGDLVAAGERLEAQSLADAFLRACRAQADRLGDADALATVRRMQDDCAALLGRDQASGKAAYFRSTNTLRSRAMGGGTRSMDVLPPQPPA